MPRFRQALLLGLCAAGAAQAQGHGATASDFDGLRKRPERHQQILERQQRELQHQQQQIEAQQQRIDDLERQEPALADTLDRSAYDAVNLIYSPLPKANLGLESLHGYRENAGGDSGDAGRLRTSAQFFF